MNEEGKNLEEVEISKRFAEIDASGYPDFYSYEKPLEMGLWILWVAKEELGIRSLTAEQIASIIIDIEEININAKSITLSFNRAGDKIHAYQEGGKVYFEIMKPGKDHLLSQAKEGSIDILYFEPGKRYTSKRILSKNILGSLNGELRIVDPYCGVRTLDILENVKNEVVRFLTNIEKLRNKKSSFLRHLKDFKSERPNIEFRSYTLGDIHDRYIISSECLVILGYSIQNLGAKESFAIILNKNTCENIVEALIENFDKRWEQSNILV
ncbi:MAG: hypothetical protein WED07_06495 [Candidatus Freyarchaeum deiterrae]